MSINITIAKNRSIFSDYGTYGDLEITFSDKQTITLKGPFNNGSTKTFDFTPFFYKMKHLFYKFKIL
jgi:hypothetical protein